MYQDLELIYIQCILWFQLSIHTKFENKTYEKEYFPSLFFSILCFKISFHFTRNHNIQSITKLQSQSIIHDNDLMTKLTEYIIVDANLHFHVITTQLIRWNQHEAIFMMHALLACSRSLSEYSLSAVSILDSQCAKLFDMAKVQENLSTCGALYRYNTPGLIGRNIELHR